MPIQSCPACVQQTPRHLYEESDDSYVNYYICPACGHIWTVNKYVSSFVTHVTPLTTKPPAQRKGAM